MRAHGWARPEWHPSIGSTNTAALGDPRPGRVVVADHQSAGQGRRGRSWTAPPDTALAVSVVVPAPAPDLRGWVPLATGLAVSRALSASRYAVSAGLKWPNDVLVPERGRWLKVAGVLAQAQGDVIVIGTGLNVDQSRDQLPVASATSWRLARGGALLPDDARESWLADYLAHLAGLLEDLAGDPWSVAAAYRRECRTLGTDVQVHLPGGGVASGQAIDVDASGALLVQDEDGVGAHLAGDVVHVRPRLA